MSYIFKITAFRIKTTFTEDNKEKFIKKIISCAYEQFYEEKKLPKPRISVINIMRTLIDHFQW